jgi:multisubunit Na+/H+ antiporter MnhG subunit
MAMAALVLGILAVVFAFIPFLNFLSPILGIIGIILAVMSRKQEKSSAATAGLILSIIGLALGIFMWIACTVCAAGVQKAVDNPDFQKKLEEATKTIDNPELRKAVEEAQEKLKDATENINKSGANPDKADADRPSHHPPLHGG